MSIDRIKKFLILFLIVLIFFQPFMVVLGSGEDDDDSSSVIEVDSLDGLLERGNVEEVKNFITYDEGMQLFLTKSFLKSEKPYIVPEYANIFNGEGNCSSSKCYDNNMIIKSFMEEIDKADELTEAEKNGKGVYRLPISISTKGLTDVIEGKTSEHRSLTVGHLVYEKDGKTHIGDIDVLANDYEGSPTVYAGNEYGHFDLSRINGYSGYKVATKWVGSSKKTEKSDKPFKDYNTGLNSNNRLNGNSYMFFRQAFVSLNKGFEDYNSTLFLDSYGNIVSNNSEVLIPYWSNMTVDIFNESFHQGKMNKTYLSSHLGRAVDGNGVRFIGTLGSYYKHSSSYFHEVRASTETAVHLKDEELRSEFTSIFGSDGHKQGKENVPNGSDDDMIEKIKSIYKNEEYLDILAQYIVSKTRTKVEEYNLSLYEVLLETQEKEGSLKVSIDDGTYNRSGGSGPGDIDEAKEYIAEAAGIIKKISRFLEIGFFELLRLTLAGFVSDFYNSNIISFSVSDVFHTSLISDSALWHNIVNTMLLLVVCFTGLYVVFLSLKMFMGTITPKGILMRVLVLAIAVASPMILYSPIVNLLFNVPAERILDTEMNRMMVLDTWLKNKMDVSEEYDEISGFKTTKIYREREEDYTIEFVTDTTVEGEKIIDLDESSSAFPLNKNKMVTVDVSVFHILSWLEDVERKMDGAGTGDEDNSDDFINENTGLFEYLGKSTKTNKYYKGIEDYNEYSFNTTNKVVGIDGFNNDDNLVMASELIKDFYFKYNNIETPVIDNLIDVTSKLFYGTKESTGEPYTSKEVEIVLSELSMSEIVRKEKLGSNDLSEYVKNLMTDGSMETLISSGDLLMLSDLLKPLKNVRFGKEIELGDEIQDINRTVIDKYVGLYLPLRQGVNRSGENTYESSERFIIVLESYFATVDYYGMDLLPKGVNIKNLSLDSYVRTMYIPLSKFTPEERGLNDVSEYIALNIDLFSLLVFMLAILSLFLYGLVKFIVIYVLLMPLILISFFMNYVIKKDMNNKSWLGSIVILGAFGGINLALLLLWKGLIYAMNLNDINKSLNMSKGGYPYVLANSAALILFFILVYKYALKPLYKTVKSDINNLGGEVFSEKYGDITAGFSKTLDKMWNGSNVFGGKNNSGDVLGSVDINNNKKSSVGITDKDTGKASEMAMDVSNDSEVLNENDKSSLELINSKLESGSSSNVHNVLDGNRDSSGKGINKVMGRAVGKVGNKISDKFAGVRDVIGDSAYKVISGTGKVVGGSTGELLGKAAGSTVRNAITGTLGDVSNGAQAAVGIAQLTNKGVGATLAGGLLGGVLGKSGAFVKTPFTLMKAKAMATKLNSLKMSEGKYDRLRGLDESEMEKLKEAGLETQLEGIDGIGTDRDEELMYLNTPDDVIGDMVARQLDKNIGAEAVGNRVMLNLDSNEMKDEKVYSRLLNDLVEGVYESKQEVLESALEFSELGDIPVAYSVGENSYGFGNLGEYEDVFNKLVNDYESKGIGISVREDENGLKFASFSNESDSDKFLTDFEERASLYSSMVDKKGPLYTIEDGSELISLMESNNIEFEIEDNSEGFGMSFRLTDYHNDGDSFVELMESNKSIASDMLELTSGHMKSSDDVIVKQLMAEYTDSGSLIEGEDVVYRDNDVIAVSAKGKKAMSTIQENYDEERAKTLAKLDDYVGNIHESLLNIEDGINVENGLEFGVHNRNSSDLESVNIERNIKDSNIGKEHYVMRNDYDIDEMESFVNDIERRRLEIKRGNTEIEILPEEEELMETVSRIRSRGVKLERHDDTTLNVYAENEDDAKSVTDYFEGIKDVVRAREVVESRK